MIRLCASKIVPKIGLTGSLANDCSPVASLSMLPSRKYSSEPKEQQVEVDGVNINYVKVGNGPKPVLCFPGMLGSIWSDFKPQVEKLDRAKLTVVAWDPLGYGGSRPPSRQFPPDFYYQDAEWALKLMKALDIPKFSLLGWSDGGISSLILAAKYPDNVDKLIVWGANSYVSEHDIKLYEGIRDPSKWSDRMKAPLIKMYGEEYFKVTLGGWCDALADIQKNQQGGDICKWLLPVIRSPTFVIHGAKDAMVPVSHPQYLLQHIKNVRYHEFADGKHNLHLKYADEFNKLVEDFLTH